MNVNISERAAPKLPKVSSRYTFRPISTTLIGSEDSSFGGEKEFITDSKSRALGVQHSQCVIA